MGRIWSSLGLLLALSCRPDAATDTVASEPPRHELAPLSRKEQLGRRLFYDVRLSVNEKRACGTCHEQAKAFTDGFAKAIGATRELHTLNTPSLANLTRRGPLGWAQPHQRSLERQLLLPLTGETPVEMGMTEGLLHDRLSSDPWYVSEFARLYPDRPRITLANTAEAIVAFERLLISDESPVDRFLRGDSAALTATERRGLELFNGQARCATCHSGPDWDRPLAADGSVAAEPGYFNIGLYNTDGLGAYPPGSTGLHGVTGLARDMGRYRTPSLRNVALTGPYLHDGTELTLERVVQLHLRGGRLVTVGPHPGNGRLSPLRDARLVPVALSTTELHELESFLHALTDRGFIENPRLSDPFRVGVPEIQ